MKHLKSVLEQLEFHLVLFILALIMCFFPLFILPDADSPVYAMLSFFIAWALVIAALYFTGQFYTERESGKNTGGKQGEADV